MMTRKFSTVLLLRMFLAAITSCLSFQAVALSGINAVSFRDVPGAKLGDYRFLTLVGDDYHLGSDVLTLTGSTDGKHVCGGIVYAPGDGIVETVRDAAHPGGDATTPGTFVTLGNTIMIRHPGAGDGGKDIFSLFLHLQEAPLVSEGDHVTADTIIGHIGKTGTAANHVCHAHVELRYFPQMLFPIYNNIYNIKNDDFSQMNGNWRDPEKYSLNLIPLSYFDGAGSLVDPANGGNCSTIKNHGCSLDFVKLFPHSTPSTGVFQIFSNPQRCNRVRIEGLSSAYIGVKRWDETYPGNADGLSTIYRAKYLPVDVALPTVSNGTVFTLISVTSTAKIPTGSSRYLKVACLNSAASTINAPGQLIDIAPPISERQAAPQNLLIRLAANIYWSGSGSLINNYSGTPSAVGRTYDEAIKFSQRKSLLSFQIYSNGVTCKSVRITGSGLNSGTTVEASIKKWNDATWNAPTISALPLDIALPSYGVFWILKLKPAAIGAGNLTVACL